MAWLPTFLRIFSVLLGLTIILLTVPQLIRHDPKNLPPGFYMHGVALELVDEEKYLNSIKQRYSDGEIRRDLKLDYLLAIPAYLIFFLALGLWFIAQGFSLARALGMAIMICVVGAVVFDVLENMGICSLLRSLDPARLQATLDHKTQASVIKWSLLAIDMLLAAVFFLRYEGFPRVVGALYLLAFLVGAGLVVYRPLAQYFFVLMGVAIALTGEAVHLIVRRPPG